ncbi:MAG: UDP-N-acetylmuramate dehydrogenase [Candidatus Omnitrophica bacterium]|nr:UDP-N-acetylmuramate dehydrogenase [Candidatus Omnitrophota bacterium]
MDLSFLNQIGVQYTPQARLAEHTTFRVGGPCLALVECRNAKELTLTVLTLRQHNLPFLLMGFGSNILASDQGIHRIIVRHTTTTPNISMRACAEPNLYLVTADSATQLDDVVAYTINNGLEGLLPFSGIPGTLGGAIAGNAGAYGQQLADTLESLTILRPDNSVVTVPKSAIHFEYRDSDLKHNGDIVLSATIKLPRNGNIEQMKNNRAANLAMRVGKHGRWQDTPCAGSFFRNVEPTSKAGPRQSAGWFLEQAGCKDMNLNGAHSYHNHANIITRDVGAKAQDVYDLTCAMACAVKAKFGLELVREVRLLGPFENAPACDPQGYW